jgi:hypothetical protein
VSDISERSFGESININGQQVSSFTNSSSAEAEPLVVKSVVPTCIACSIIFESRSEQVEHFKSEGHRLKLLERVQMEDEQHGPSTAAKTVENNKEESEEEGDDEDEGEDEDKIEADEEEEAEVGEFHSLANNRGWWLRLGHPTLCFTEKRNRSWAVELSTSLFAKSRKELIYAESEGNVLKPSLYSLTSNAHSNAVWCIILMRSGRFAAGIYQGDTLVKHKVIKRYTTRKGQGGSQSSMDATGT